MKNDILRKWAIRIFHHLNPGDITIRHHYTGEKFLLHSFRHKNYWYHGKKREKKSMSIFPEVIGPGDLVVEIGGHIGYLTVYFSGLVGPKGRVLVFEPGRNNLPYLRKNLASHANGTLVEKAVADFTGPATFHLENLSGQNNSLIKNYKLFAENLESAGIARVETSVMEVGCTTLDCFWSENNLPAPSFVKIDVEGAEMSVLRGMKNVVQKNDVALMVEVSENHADVFHLLKEYGFLIFDDSRRPIQAPRFISGNLFCLKENDKRTGRLLPLQGSAKNPKTGSWNQSVGKVYPQTANRLNAFGSTGNR